MKQKPYKNTISNWLIVAAIIAIIVSMSSCAATKKDCRGVKHYRQSGGFYL